MANTTFNGPVRSDNGFETISKNATTGAVTIEADYNVRPNFRASIDNSTFAGAGGAHIVLLFDKNAFLKSLKFHFPFSVLFIFNPNSSPCERSTIAMTLLAEQPLLDVQFLHGVLSHVYQLMNRSILHVHM